eukprot:5612455-Pyramimonas_sp.AAC.1
MAQDDISSCASPLRAHDWLGATFKRGPPTKPGISSTPTSKPPSPPAGRSSATQDRGGMAPS